MLTMGFRGYLETERLDGSPKCQFKSFSLRRLNRAGMKCLFVRAILGSLLGRGSEHSHDDEVLKLLLLLLLYF